MCVELSGSDFEPYIFKEDTGVVAAEYINRTRLSTPQGDIYFTQQPLKKDWFILDSEYRMDEDVAISGQGDTSLLELQFNLSDESIFYEDQSRKRQVAPAGTGNMVFLSAEDNKARIYFNKEVTYRTFDIHLPVTLFDVYAGESKLVDGFLKQLHADRSAQLAPHAIAVTPAIYHTIQDIRSCRYDGLTRSIYLESKAWELIALSIDVVQNQQQDVALSKADQERIHQAAAIIRNNLERPCSIIDLARMVGVNQTKLKTGFKSVFDNTVFGYLQEIRMAQAKKHLLDTELSVQEISQMMGYQNLSNFSTAFKRCYGISPQKLRQKNMKCYSPYLMMGEEPE